MRRHAFRALVISDPTDRDGHQDAPLGLSRDMAGEPARRYAGAQDALLAALRDPGRPGASSWTLAQLLESWVAEPATGASEFWQAVAEAAPRLGDEVTRVLRNPGVRQVLLDAGQRVDVWDRLLATSTDPEEATRLLSLLAAQAPRRALQYLHTPAKRAALPVGTRLPVALATAGLAADEAEGGRAVRLSTVRAAATMGVDHTPVVRPPRRRRA